jgi:excisionase family DNA binding protein
MAMNKKTKRVLALAMQHIQKTNELVSAVILALNEETESAPVIQQATPSFPQKEIMTVAEAAEYCGYSKTYMYQLAHQGEVPYHKPMGGRGRTVFKRSELDEFILRRKQDADYEIQDKAAAILNGEAV